MTTGARRPGMTALVALADAGASLPVIVGPDLPVTRGGQFANSAHNQNT